MRNLTCNTLVLGLCLIANTILAQEDALELIDNLVAQHGTIGCAAGYSIDGETIWSGSEGLSCLEGDLPFETSTLTRIASIAKPMTAVAIMQLVEYGSVSLDDQIGTILQNLPDDKSAITIRQLLTHTSGISQYQNTREVENTVHYATLEDAMAVFIDRPLLFEPGSGYFYTSYGYVVLGRIIEIASGLDFEAYMQANVWDKAGMTNTGVESVSIQYPNKACLYHKAKKKAKSAHQNDLSNRIPGGGFYSTLDDLLKFGNALVDGTLITQSSLEEMSQIGFDQEEGNPYGMGWFLYGPPPHQSLVIGHSGEQTGCSSQLMIIPKSKTVVVVLANTSGMWKEVISVCSQLVGISER